MRKKKFHITIPQESWANPIRTLCRPDKGYLRGQIYWLGSSIVKPRFASLLTTMTMCKTCEKYVEDINETEWIDAWTEYEV